MRINHVVSIFFSGIILGTALLVMSCLPCRAAPQPVPSAGPIFHRNLSIGWRLNIGAPISQPPIAHDGKIYAVSDRGDLVALGTNGTKLWATSLLQQPQPERFSTPPLGIDQFILAGTDKGFIHAFNIETGAFKWKVKIGEDVYGALNWLPPEGTNGFSVLALARNNGSLFRLELTTGRVIWSSKPGGRSDGSPAVRPGFAVFGACDSALHLIDTATGHETGKIAFPEQGPMAGGAAVDGTLVYIGTRDGSLVCANTTTLTPAWTNHVAGGEIFTTPALATHRIIAGSNDGFLYCLNRTNGQPIWKVPTQGTPTSPMIIGNTIVVTSGGTLSLIRMEDGKTLWTHSPCDLLTAPTVTADKVMVGTDDGFIILYQ